MITLEDIMTPNPQTLTTQNTVVDAQNLMIRLGIRHIPIVDSENKLAGIFSQRDLFAAMESSRSDLNITERFAIENKKTLQDVMSTAPATVSPNASLREVALFLQNKKYGCLPIVDHGELIGIVTDSDFVSVAINLLEQIELAEPLAADEF